MIDLDAVVLGRVMVHDVPRGGTDAEPTLTEAPVELNAALLDYFRSKLVASLKTRGIEVVADPEATGTIREVVTRIVAEPRSLAEQSRAAAEHLAATQNGHNPEGLLVVAEADLGGTAGVALMKLERESGIRFDITADGQYAKVNLELLRQLTLTNKTRVFKTAVLTCESSPSSVHVIGRASDNQRTQTEGRGVADFFLGTFLGCKLATNPAQATLKFAETVTGFVNSATLSPETRGNYSIALLTELGSNTIDVSPRHFVSDYIAVEHRSDLLTALRDAGVDPDTAFQKDTTLVRYDKIRVTFESGIVLVGATADVRDRVRLRGEGETPGAEVNDIVDTVAGR